MADPSRTHLLRQRSLDRRVRWALCAVVLVGIGVRGLYLAEIADSPQCYAPAVDAEFHHYWASAIATGDWTPRPGQADPQIRTTPYLRPPGYPYFLSTIYRMAGPGFLAPRLVQMALGLINGVLAYFVARKCRGRLVALLFAAFMTFNWVFVYFEGRLLEPSLIISLFLGALLFLQKWLRSSALRHALLAGLLLGLAAAVRPNALVLIVAAAVWLTLPRRHDRVPRKPWRSVAMLALGAAIPIAPLTARNWIAADEFVLISANAGVNLYIGNNEHADGFFFAGLEGVGDFGTCFDYPRLVRNVARHLGRPLTYTQVSRYFAQRAFAYMRAHPGDVARLTLRKALLFLAPYEISHNYVVALDRSSSPILRRLPMGFALTLATCLLGVTTLFLGGHRRRNQQGVANTAGEPVQTERAGMTLLVGLFAMAYFVSFLPFFNASLYRTPWIPFLLFFAAIGVAHVMQCLTVRRWRAGGTWLATWAVLGLVCSISAIPYEPDPAEWHLKKGMSLARVERPQQAMREYQQALNIQPDDGATHGAAADALATLGRNDEAIAHWQAALLLEPDNASLHTRFADALLTMRRPDEAMQAFGAAVALKSDSVVPYFNLAQLLAVRGAYRQAIELYEAGLRIDSNAYEGHMGMGVALAKLGAVDLGIQHCAKAVRLRPDSIEAHLNLGVVLNQAGRSKEAIRQYLDVLSLSPRNAHACHNLGVVHQGLGRLAEAASWYGKALAIDATLGLSLRNLGQVMLAMDRPEEAVGYFERAGALTPSDAAANRDYGIALVRSGRVTAGIAHLEKTLQKDAANVATRLALAQAFEASGNLAAAIEQYRAVLELHPDHAQARSRLDALRE